MITKLNSSRDLIGKTIKIKCPECGKIHVYHITEKDVVEISRKGVATVALPCTNTHVLIITFDRDGVIRGAYVYKLALSKTAPFHLQQELEIEIINQKVDPLPSVDLIIIYPTFRIIDISLAQTRDKSFLMKIFKKALMYIGEGIQRDRVGKKIAYFISNSNNIVFVCLSPLSKASVDALEMLSYDVKKVIKANVIKEVLEFARELEKLTPYAQETIIRIINADKLKVSLVSESALKFGKTTLKILLRNKFYILEEMLKYDLLNRNLSIAEIAATLKKPIREILSILRELEKRGIIKISF